MSKYKMFIDELGVPHKNHKSDHYILMGCIIEKDKQADLEIKANLIKYRYWKSTDVVFHSREMGLSVDGFAIFKDDDKKKAEFQKDLISFLSNAPIRITSCVVDKKRVYGYPVPWTQTTIIKKTSDTLILDFLRHLYIKNSSGIIIFESSGFDKDGEYLKSFNKVLTPGWVNKNPQFANIREHLTSITFATKLNHDIECEIADLMSYAALCKYQQQEGIKTFASKSYENKMIEVLNKKMLGNEKVISSKAKKQKYSTEITGFRVLPPKKSSK